MSKAEMMRIKLNDIEIQMLESNLNLYVNAITNKAQSFSNLGRMYPYWFPFV